MSKAEICFNTFFIVVCTQFCSVTVAQFKVKANAETGYYTASGKSVINRNDFQNCIDSQLSYAFKSENRSAELKLRVRPEFYCINNPLKTIKFGADGSYNQKEKMFNWGFELNRQLYNFNGQDMDLAYDSFTILADGSLFLLENFPISALTGYGYQKINNSVTQDLEYYLLDLSSSLPLSTYTKFGYGIYLENFSITDDFSITPGVQSNYLDENKGWRFGPQVGFYYLKDAVLDVDYRFMVHNSLLTDNFSYEQWVRLVAGKLITSRWSAFLLADFYFRNFQLKTNGQNNLSLLYNSLNIDNRIYIKTGYELSDHFEIYLRTGYFKENLVTNKFSYSGWNTLLGVEVGN